MIASMILRPEHITAAKFALSAPNLKMCPPDSGAEIAFAGRSNAGKSSALNAITQQKSLARVSKTPGRTQLLNFFDVSPTQRLVDLPGYGFAKAPEAEKRKWARMIEQYLLERECLVGLILIMDIRHPLSPLDAQMLDWCASAGLTTHILLSKADKIRRGPGLQQLQKVQNGLKPWDMDASVQRFSALDKTGVKEARSMIAEWLSADWHDNDADDDLGDNDLGNNALGDSLDDAIDNDPNLTQIDPPHDEN